MNKYHFIGLGGIGMSGLARFLKKKGCLISGSDQNSSPLLDVLKKEGITVQSALLKKDDSHAIVYSTAIKEDHPELVSAKKEKRTTLHRSELLGKIAQDYHTIAVSGTHGKTTTSALMSWILKEVGKDPSFIIGGILKEIKSNAHLGNSSYFVMEADESDGSFLNYSVQDAIVTGIEEDHLDYWKTKDRLIEGFSEFIQNVSGKLFWHYDDLNLRGIRPKGMSYGFSRDADIQIQNLTQKGFVSTFDLSFQSKLLENFTCPLIGRHNLLNAAAVIGYVLSLGHDLESIKKALKTFPGVSRRMDRKNPDQSFSYYDDYAHHPTAIFETLKSLKDAVEERKVIAVFQPHRYSRTKDCYEQILTCFSYADEVFITDIYSAGENPIPDIDARELKKQIQHKNVVYCARGELPQKLASHIRPLDVIIGLGAGDIHHLFDEINPLYRSKDARWKVALVYGGISVEHEVAVISKNYVSDSLDPGLYDVKEFYVSQEGLWNGKILSSETVKELLDCEIAFPVFHGPFGEDGMIQGFFETIGLAYVGCNYQSSSLVMHKAWTKAVAKVRKIATSKYRVYFKNQFRLDEENFNLTFPCWVKPVHLGSSIGIKKVETIEKLHDAFQYAFRYDDTALVEEEIWGRQIEIGIIGNDYQIVSTPCEILNGQDFYDYEKKYRMNLVKIPAEIPKVVRTQIVHLAKTMYRACGCSGFARIDFFLDQANKVWFNEINPIPGMTPTSAFQRMFEYDGFTGKEIINRLMFCALERKRLARNKLGIKNTV